MNIATTLTPRERLQRHRFAILLGTLVLLLIVSPATSRRTWGEVALELLVTLMVVAAVWSVSEKPIHRWIGLGLLLPSLILQWTGTLLVVAGRDVSHSLTTTAHLFTVLFLAHAALVLVMHALRHGRVDEQKICAALCAYLMAGIIWAMLYTVCEQSTPGAFNIAPALEAARQGEHQTYGDFTLFLYYSFVTLSTLGYGDVTPLSAPARTLAWSQAIFGQLYLAVLIARLVGLHIAHTMRSGE